MPQYTLTVLDTAGIQSYIFGSNVLRENIGGSELVWRATQLWPLELVQALEPSNVKSGDLGGTMSDLEDSLQLEADQLSAEVIYAGGGKCAVLFADGEIARRFTTDLSKLLVSQAPDLDLIVTHETVDWDQPGGLIQAEEAALQSLAAKKMNRATSTPLLGLGVTVACQSTGLPAVGTDGDEPDLKPRNTPPRPLSAGILAKLRVVEAANRRLKEYLPQFREYGFTMPHEFDNFGREAGESSYIAVVHADGNRLGSRIKRLQEKYKSSDNRTYLQARRTLSAEIERAGERALKALSSLLLRHTDPAAGLITGRVLKANGDLQALPNQVRLSQGDRTTFIPFRPLVFGGDDLTFVTDGRLGLPLANAYLQAFEMAMNNPDHHYTSGFKACAGVAVVKTHYPFARAYTLADDLCRNAKQVWDRQCSALDWHFVATGIFGDIESIRQRQYTVPAGHLEMRPLPLTPQKGDWRSWAGFAQVTKAFLLHQEWQDRRNKIIDLREALRQGPQAVEQFRRAYEVNELPRQAAGIQALQRSGWDGADRCGYFDPIEALDFFTPLEG